MVNRKAIKGEISSTRLEDGTEIMLDFDKLKKIANAGEPVVPVAVQDVDTKEVLIIAYANQIALEYTLKHKKATFWSTSRSELWIKGETSGDTLQIVDVYVNCDQNSLLYMVKMVGKGSCHTKKTDGKTRFGCYYRKIKDDVLVFNDGEK